MNKTPLLVFALASIGSIACSSSNDTASGGGGSRPGSGGSGGVAPASGGGGRGTGGGGAATGGAPADFWGDTSDIPVAKNVMTFKFLNRTNGAFDDAHVFWRFKQNGVDETHSIAEAPTYDMPVSPSGRMYFYVEMPDGKYYDFIEHTIGAAQYNGNTTRVDAFGLKIALRLHSAEGFDVAVGDAYELFSEKRDATFERFVDEVPDAFKHLAQIQAPYRIVQPGAGEFKTGGKYEHYYDSFANTLWANNGITVAKPGPNGDGLGCCPNLSAALMRHVGGDAGSLAPDGSLMNKALWDDASTFYSTEPADYYARFWHRHGIDGKAYGFPYDDVGSYSSYISHSDPQYLLVAIGY
jgi:hypothetical protein